MSDDLQTTLRDSLSASFDAAEESQTPEPVAQEPQAAVESAPQESVAEQRARDEAGRFAPKTEAPKVDTPVQQAAEEPPPQRPTTWKKEYLPIWDKTARGEPLTPDEAKKLAAYSMQREKEYATGVSTYRSEAQNAKHLTDALTPYHQIMQERGMTQQQFIKTMGDTYVQLLRGSPEQRIRAIAQLANDVQVPLHAIAQVQQGQQIDPVVPQLMQYIQQLEQKVNTVTNSYMTDKEQQQDREVKSMIAKFENDPEKFPHFAQVRGTMGQLLGAGFTQDLEVAYAKAVRMNDDVWSAEQERQAQLSATNQSANKAAVAQQARAKAVSPRSVSPTGNPTTVNPKDVRSLLESSFDSHSGSRV